MSCFFCSSNDHVTIMCNVYKSDEERQKILLKKDYCKNNFFEQHSGQIWCECCKEFVKCYHCFTPTHHTLCCPDRFKMSNLFPPKIDQNLFSRFLKMLTFEEKHFLIFSFPSILASIPLMPLRIKYMEDASTTNPDLFTNMDLFVADRLFFDPFLFKGQNNGAKNLCTSTVFRIKNLHLHRPLLSDVECLRLLSPKTKTFRFTNTLNQQKLIFHEILEKAPYLEDIAFSHYDVEISSTWPDELLELNHGTKLNFSFTISEANFDVQSLATLMKSKPVTGFLNIRMTHEDSKNGTVRQFKKNLSKYFDSFAVKPVNEQFVSITFDYVSAYAMRKVPLYYKVKKRKNSV